MDMFAQVPCAAGAPGVPETKLIIRGQHAPKVFALLNLLRQTDAALVKAVRESALAEEAAGLTDEECAQWARDGALSELRELAGEAEQ